jgi:hypothetical protein
MLPLEPDKEMTRAKHVGDLRRGRDPRTQARTIQMRPKQGESCMMNDDGVVNDASSEL